MNALDLLRAAKERLRISEEREERSFDCFVGDNEKKAHPANKAKLVEKPSSPYAYPWPNAIPGLGDRHVGPYEACVGCGRGTWARYGAQATCLPCATRGVAGGQ
jgi:hypothetical protein